MTPWPHWARRNPSWDGKAVQKIYQGSGLLPMEAPKAAWYFVNLIYHKTESRLEPTKGVRGIAGQNHGPLPRRDS